MPLSNYLANALIDHLIGGAGYTPATKLYFALFTSSPSASGGGTEVSGGSYARVEIDNNSTSFATASGREKATGIGIQWPVATAAWGTITHVGVFDAASSGNLLCYSALASSASVSSGDDFSIPSGEFKVQVVGALANDSANSLLNLAFGATTYSRLSNVYLAAMTTTPDNTGGGVEASGGSYERVALANNSTNFPNASAGVKSNGVVASFPKASSSWGTITGLAIYSSAFGGTLLIYDSLEASKTVAANNTLRLPVGGLTITFS